MRGVTSRAMRRVVRWAAAAAAAVLIAVAAIAAGYALYADGALPDLAPWHTIRLEEEFSARRHRDLDLAGYLALEDRLFDEVAAKLETTRAAAGGLLAATRYDPAGGVARLAPGAPYNRTFRLAADPVRGAALLVHGLTDSPYSMRAFAEALHARGFDVTALRVPGHGTIPAALTTVGLEDWRAAVRIAYRDVAARVGPDRPLWVGGYSTGATVVLLQTLETLKDPDARRPDRVLLVSPAIALSRIAALANVVDLFGFVPGLGKARWETVRPEYDPYKYNSFPINAARQVNAATKALHAELASAAAAGRIDAMPPVTAWQSVVDSTVGPTGIAETLFARLAGARHHLVLFDVNRTRALELVQSSNSAALIRRLIDGPRAWTLTVVGNVSPDGRAVCARRHEPGKPPVEEPLGLEWPPNLVSLGHVALPFRPDDPVYGFLEGSGANGIPALGSWWLRGEEGAIIFPLGALIRLRSNPFWSSIESQVSELAAADSGRR